MENFHYSFLKCLIFHNGRNFFLFLLHHWLLHDLVKPLTYLPRWQESEIFTSLSAARRLVEQKGHRPLLLLEDSALEDFKGVCKCVRKMSMCVLPCSDRHFMQVWTRQSPTPWWWDLLLIALTTRLSTRPSGEQLASLAEWRKEKNSQSHFSIDSNINVLCDRSEIKLQQWRHKQIWSSEFIIYQLGFVCDVSRPRSSSSSSTFQTSWSWSSVLLHIHHSPSTPSLPPFLPPLAGWSLTVRRSSPSTRRATTGEGMVWRLAPGPSWLAWSLLQRFERWWWESLRRPSSLRLVRHPEEQRGLWVVFLNHFQLILSPSCEEIRRSSWAAVFFNKTWFLEETESEHLLSVCRVEFMLTAQCMSPHSGSVWAGMPSWRSRHDWRRESPGRNLWPYFFFRFFWGKNESPKIYLEIISN